MIHFVKELTI